MCTSLEWGRKQEFPWGEFVNATQQWPQMRIKFLINVIEKTLVEDLLSVHW